MTLSVKEWRYTHHSDNNKECRSTVSCRDDRLLETRWKAKSCSCKPALYWSDREGAVLLPERYMRQALSKCHGNVSTLYCSCLRKGEKVTPDLKTLKLWFLILSLLSTENPQTEQNISRRKKKIKKKRKKTMLVCVIQTCGFCEFWNMVLAYYLPLFNI